MIPSSLFSIILLALLQLHSVAGTLVREYEFKGHWNGWFGTPEDRRATEMMTVGLTDWENEGYQINQQTGKWIVGAGPNCYSPGKLSHPAFEGTIVTLIFGLQVSPVFVSMPC
jgi:hypothetical protein